MKAITYNSVSLQTSSIVMTGLEFQAISKDISMSRISTTDINKFVESYVSNKNIVYTGYIKGTDADNAEQIIDNLKQTVLNNDVKNLDIEYAGSTRRYRVITQSLDITKETPSLDVKEIKIVFATVEPLGLDTTATEVNYLAETGNPITKTVVFDGTYYTLPIYTITVSSGTALTSLSIKSVQTNQEMIIQKSYAPGDVIEINTREKTVKYNGANSDYFGIFPLVNQGANDITITPISTSHSLNINIEYIARYL